MIYFTMTRSLLVIGCLISTLLAPCFVDAQQVPVNKSDFDLSVRVQDDLFRHVNGTWLDKTKIPSDKSNYGAFTVLTDLSQSRIKAIVDEVSKGNNVKGTDEQKVADIFRSYMDEAKAEELKAKPIKQELASIEAITSKAEVIDWFAKFNKIGIGSPIATGVSQDQGDATKYIMYMSQSGTSLPDRDYYLDADKQPARDALLAYIEKLFTLTELAGQRELAKDVLKLETFLARAQWSRVETRDANKTYNKLDMEALNKLGYGVIDFEKYFEGNDVSVAIEQVVVRTPSFFEELATIIEAVDLDVWKAYLQFRYIDSAAPMLSKDFVDAHFDLYDKELSGIEEQKPRWKRGVDLVSGRLGEVVGKLYVQKHFKPEAKAEMEKLVPRSDTPTAGKTIQSSRSKQMICLAT